MAGKTVKIRGNTIALIATAIPAAKELIAVTDRIGLRIGDGSTTGGIGFQQTSYISISVAGSSNVNLTESQSQHSCLALTGALTGNIIVTPSTTLNTGKLYSVNNSTSGSYTLTFGTGGVVIPQGSTAFVYYNGTVFVDAVSGIGGSFYVNVGNLFVGGTSSTGLTGTGGLRVFSTTEATASAGAAIVDGGLLVKKALFVNSTTASTSVSTGALVNAGGFANGGAIFTNGSVNIQSSTGLPTSTNTGATISYETPITRFYFGDGTGYSLRFSKRLSSSTLDFVTFTDVGNVGIGVVPNVSAGLDIQRRLIWLGDDQSSPGSRSDSAIKWGQITSPHYTIAEEMVHGFGMYNDSTTNRLYIGGALTASYNSVTNIYFATAANNTTVSGTIRAGIDSAGQLLIITNTASTSVTTGSLVNSGGFGNSGSAYIGGLLNVAGAVIGSIQALSGAGAISTTTLTTALTTTGVNALTLADGTAGQVKIITHVSDSGDGTLTPTTKTGYTTITFSAVGQSVMLQFHTTLGWMVVSNYGTAIA